MPGVSNGEILAMNEKKNSDRKDDALPPELERYSRQIRFPGIGLEGQQRLGKSKVLLVGCGALGSVIANTLVRAGVGHLRIVDRDYLELSNLQRQVLYDEEDVRLGLPKAIAAAKKLNVINSSVVIEPIVGDLSATNIESHCENVDVIVDGTDNFETRFLINDVSIKRSIPWVFGGCLGSDGQSMTILPGESACLNCLMLDGPPPPGTTATCDSFGILGPIINIVASLQASEAMKILSGNRDQVNRHLSIVDLWNGVLRTMDVSKLRESVDCPACNRNEFEWLSGRRGSQSAVLCGRNAVQLSFVDGQPISLKEVADRLEGVAEVEANEYLLRFTVDGFKVTAFPDGRAIVVGTEEIAVAKKLYAQYLGF